MPLVAGPMQRAGPGLWAVCKVFQLKVERQGNAELRHIVADLMQRVPELESAREPREGHVTVSEETGKGRGIVRVTDVLRSFLRASMPLLISRGSRARRCCSKAPHILQGLRLCSSIHLQIGGLLEWAIVDSNH